MSLFNSLVRLTLPIAPRPVIRFFARRYVAGTTVEQAVATVRRLAGQVFRGERGKGEQAVRQAGQGTVFEHAFPHHW